MAVSLVSGDLELGKVSASLEADRNSARTNGSYTKMTFNASRNQRITNTVSLA